MMTRFMNQVHECPLSRCNDDNSERIDQWIHTHFDQCNTCAYNDQPVKSQTEDIMPIIYPLERGKLCTNITRNIFSILISCICWPIVRVICYMCSRNLHTVFFSLSSRVLN